jgi:hypothetical protein
MQSHMARLEAIVARLPETSRVDIEAWGGEPTFRVRDKVFVFAAGDASSISVKLPKEEAAAVVATDPSAEPTGYGMGRHGFLLALSACHASFCRRRYLKGTIRVSNGARA